MDESTAYEMRRVNEKIEELREEIRYLRMTIDRAKTVLRNDLYKSRVKNALDLLDDPEQFYRQYSEDF